VTNADVPELPAGGVQAWWASPADARSLPVASLSPIERARRDAYRQGVDRDRFTVGAVLVRLLLAAHTSRDAATLAIDRTCPVCAKPHGRPRLAGAGVEVSVSHAGDRVVVACGRVPALGVDVEPAVAPADVRAMVEAVLSPAESAAPEHFLSYWTRKEAVLKATGDGLRVPMADVTVTAADLPPALLAFRGRPDLPQRTTMATLAAGDGYLAALAVIDASEFIVTEHTASTLLARFVADMDAR
jgi:4'-phosphopantetheinyl transferase